MNIVKAVKQIVREYRERKARMEQQRRESAARYAFWTALRAEDKAKREREQQIAANFQRATEESENLFVLRGYGKPVSPPGAALRPWDEMDAERAAWSASRIAVSV